MTSLDELIPAEEQRLMEARSVFLETLRIAAICDCLGCRYTADEAITLARIAGASTREIRQAWETGRRES